MTVRKSGIEWPPDPQMGSPATGGTVNGAKDRTEKTKQHKYRPAARSPQALARATYDVFAGRELIGTISETYCCCLAWSADLLLVGTYIDRYAAANAIVAAHRGSPAP